MTLADLISRLTRERDALGVAPPTRRRRPAAALLRYAVLGAVALSILPAPSAAAAPAPPARDKAGARGNSAGPQREPARPTPTPAFEHDRAQDVLPPPRVNTRPFKDLLLRAARMREAGQLDLNRTIELTAEADRRDDGSLDNIKLGGPAASDPVLRGLAQDAAAAVSESRLLRFLDDARHVSLKFTLDRERLAASLSSEVASEERARQLAAGYGALLAYARVKDAGRPAGLVWNNAAFVADGKQLTMRLEMSRQEAGRLLLQLVTPD